MEEQINEDLPIYRSIYFIMKDSAKKMNQLFLKDNHVWLAHYKTSNRLHHNKNYKFRTSPGMPQGSW